MTEGVKPVDYNFHVGAASTAVLDVRPSSGELEMTNMSPEATFLEDAVCNSEKKELRIFCHAESGRGWVEVGGRRFVGNAYVQAARHLHARERLSHRGTDNFGEIYELGHHACSKPISDK